MIQKKVLMEMADFEKLALYVKGLKVPFNESVAAAEAFKAINRAKEIEVEVEEKESTEK